MSFVEARQWAAYRQRHGPLTAGERLEQQFAMLQSMIVQALGGSAAPGSFLLDTSKRAPESTKSMNGVTIEEAAAAFNIMVQ